MIGDHADAPAFALAREGYDVWLGNSRGNKYSEKHLNPNISREKYWDFTFEEMGIYDLPASFEYVLNYTKQEKLAYIGFSSGTTQMFYALAVNETYFKDKVSVFIALGPVTSLKYVRTLVARLIVLSGYYISYDNILAKLGIYESF